MNFYYKIVNTEFTLWEVLYCIAFVYCKIVLLYLTVMLSWLSCLTLPWYDYCNTYIYVCNHESILFPLQSDKSFSGAIRYPLPKKNAQAKRIGYGDVFKMYHDNKTYAVKKVWTWWINYTTIFIFILICRCWDQRGPIFILSYATAI